MNKKKQQEHLRTIGMWVSIFIDQNNQSINNDSSFYVDTDFVDLLAAALSQTVYFPSLTVL